MELFLLEKQNNAKTGVGDNSRHAERPEGLVPWLGEGPREGNRGCLGQVCHTYSTDK